jgi:diguanylate cyclase (GGDEF)-like protein/excisionase family DNA binding protein
VPTTIPPRPTDATLSVTKAARLLGVHPNTIRAWSDAGRLRYYRINPRGDRRYRLGDLQRFLAAAESGAADGVPSMSPGTWGGRRRIDPASAARFAAGTLGQLHQPQADPLDAERHHLDLTVVSAIMRLINSHDDPDEALDAAVRAVRDAYGHHLVAVWEARGDRLSPRAFAGADAAGPLRMADLSGRYGLLGRTLAGATGRDRNGRSPLPGIMLADDSADPTLAVLPDDRPELAVAISGVHEPWGVLLVVGETRGSLGPRDLEVARVVGDGLGAIISGAQRADDGARVLHRAEALRRVASDIGSRLDLDRILAGLVDHAMVLFEADRGAVFLQRGDGQAVAEVSRGLSTEYLDSVREFPARSLPSAAVAAGRPLFSVAYRDDPRGEGVRAAVVQEGFDTLCTAPLLDGTELLGMLNIYHDRPHHWMADELDTVGALATQASVAIRAAQDYERMATWAAQLQSIQQLGARLSRLSTVAEIGQSIATELHQLIDYHNARVYRVVGQDLIPVAMQGKIGEYDDETPEQLRVTMGEGITGWVALHRVAQNLGNAAADPRCHTIPGTEDDLDESILLAPMVFDDQVLGVLVLSKLGLDRFTDDDLRLLVIYASLAAQAMANADTTERLREQTLALEQQLRGQRELLQITESILTTLDSRGVLEIITDRLGRLVACDNIAIEVLDPTTALLTPLTARGTHAARYLEPWELGETGIATWVVEHNEPVLIGDERNDPRVNHFRDDAGSEDGSLIVVPLRGRGGAIGVLTIERLGLGITFSTEEFDLVQLFAAQVSIALQNAEVFQAVEIRARTDDLTGLLNHGTFQEWLQRSVHEGIPFSLIMLDLDDFRDVNNEMGHQAGDTVLRRIAGGLVRAGRDSDLVFRYGGDEFTFLLPNTDEAGALQVAERARLAVVATDGTVTASVGVATFPRDGTTATGVLLAADRACYVAKRGGRNRIATAAEGLAQAAELPLQPPTPVDSASPPPTPVDSASPPPA